MIYRFRTMDWRMITALAVIAAASLVTLASVEPDFFVRQILWYGLAVAIIFGATFIDWRWLGSQGWFRYALYGAGLLLLIATHLQGTVIRGTKSWLVIGGFQFEPSEFMKLGLIVLLAHFFARRHLEAWHGGNVLFLLLAVGIPVALTMLHPDLGSALIILLVALGIFLSSGIHMKRFLVGLVLACIAAVLLWSFALAPYQKARITGFLFPERDPLGVSYNVIQSKIAIGSAGLFGKGFEGGTQARLQFLPAAHNDFLFAAFVEEWGMVGALVLIFAFLVVIVRVLSVGAHARENFSRFVAIGTATLFLAQFFVNVGSNVGLLPVTGLTLPFFSYGGSSLLTTALLVGIIQHIHVESSS
jgi:rod shape determining protein RodA